jgi:hypothetical protein
MESHQAIQYLTLPSNISHHLTESSRFTYILTTLINLSLRQQLAGFDNCCKSLKSIVAQLRIVASCFESKLREYNKNVKTITALATDQEEELWFINWCSVCKWICEILCEALAWIVDPCKLCGAFGVFAPIPICYISL